MQSEPTPLPVALFGTLFCSVKGTDFPSLVASEPTTDECGVGGILRCNALVSLARYRKGLRPYFFQWSCTTFQEISWDNCRYSKISRECSGLESNPSSTSAET